MSTIKVFGKENGVAILLPSGRYIYGDPDGDFVAENGAASDEVSIKRSINDFYVVRNLAHTSITDSDGNAIAASRGSVVTALNDDYFNRGSSLFEIGDVDDPGSSELSKTTPDKQLQLKVKSDGSGFELVNKPSVVEDIGGSATDIGGANDEEILGWTLSKQLEDQSSASVYRAAIRPGANVQADVSNETYGSNSYLTTALKVRDITASLTLKSGGVINSEDKNIILNPADTYVTSITRLKTIGDTIIGGDIKTASGTNDDIVIDCDGTGRVRFKSEIMPHADQDLVIHSGGTGNMIVEPDLQVDGEIVTGSNNDLVLNPGGTGAIILQADDIRFEQTTALTGGEIRLNEYNSLGENYVALRAPVGITSDVAFTLPSADGTSGQVLQTNGGGTLSFTSVPPSTSPTFNAVTSFKALGGIDAQLAIYDDDGSHAIVLRAPDSLSANTTFRLPASDGTDGQVMKTNGSGQLSFTTITNGTDGADGADGADGTGFTGGSYNSSTGVVTFTSDDGLGFSTGDLRGADGADGTDGADGSDANALAGADQSLTGNRIIQTNGNDLSFKDGLVETLKYDDSEGDWVLKTDIVLATDGGPNEIRFEENNSAGNNTVGLKAPTSIASDVTFTLPSADGSSGQVLKTDGSGALSFVDQTVNTDTNTNIANTNLTADGDRTLDMNENTLNIDVDAGGFNIKEDTTTRFQVELGNINLDGDVAINSITYPSADGSANQVLKTNGSGTLSFATITNGTDGTDGTDGTGFTGGSYDSSTGVVTFTSDDGLGFSTGDLRGADGADGTDGADGADGSDALALAGNDQTLTGNRVINTDGNNFEIKDGAVSLFTYTDATSQLMLGDITNVQRKTGPGELRFKETPTNGTNHIALQAPASLSSDTTFVLPSADGTDGQYLKTDGSGTLSFDSPNTKFTQVYSQNFMDDIGTTIHYLPFKDINEQTTVYQEEAAMLMPFDGRIKSMSIRVSSVTGSGNFTVSIRTRPSGVSQFSAQAWTIEESEVMAFTSTDDYHTFHFVFDNAQHFEAGDLCTLSLIASSDPGSFTYWYVTSVVEFDTSTDLGSSSTEHGSNP